MTGFELWFSGVVSDHSAHRDAIFFKGTEQIPPPQKSPICKLWML